MTEFVPLALDGVIEVHADKHGDARGFFSEVYNRDEFAAGGVHCTFVQDNHSLSTAKGVLRGLHFQTPPFAQDKLVRVTSGRVFDVAVDIRHGSPNFGKWVGAELSAENWKQLFVPAGFAHGFLALSEKVEFLYKVSAPYSPAHDRSIRFDDPDIAVNWPLGDMRPILSNKDQEAPLLSEITTGFTFGEF